MRMRIAVFSTALMLSLIMLWGCSSSPSKDELKRLETTQTEIVSLTQKATALKKERASIQQAINEKQAKLKTCLDDKSTVEMKLKSVQ